MERKKEESNEQVVRWWCEGSPPSWAPFKASWGGSGEEACGGAMPILSGASCGVGRACRVDSGQSRPRARRWRVAAVAGGAGGGQGSTETCGTAPCRRRHGGGFFGYREKKAFSQKTPCHVFFYLIFVLFFSV